MAKKAAAPAKPLIAVVGSVNTDMVVKVPAIPRPGETVIGNEFFMAAGGKGANQAVAAARALQSHGHGEVVFVARIGDDVFGRQAAEGFKNDGINIDFVIKDKQAASGVALIAVDVHGENAISVASGANARLTPADIEVVRPVLASASVLIIQLESPLSAIQRAAEIASAHGVRVILNPAPAQPLIGGSLLSHVSILTPNETETEILTGIAIKSDKDFQQAAAALLPIGLEAVIVTLGSRGAYVATPQEQRFIPAFEVEVVDTTAAGDVFNGALAVALAEGQDLFEAARFANAAAALSVTRLGAQVSIPRRVEIDALLLKTRSA